MPPRSQSAERTCGSVPNNGRQRSAVTPLTIFPKGSARPLMTGVRPTQTMNVCGLRNLAAALALALVLCAAPARADDVAFNHVAVVDVVGGRLLRNQLV